MTENAGTVEPRVLRTTFVPKHPLVGDEAHDDADTQYRNDDYRLHGVPSPCVARFG